MKFSDFDSETWEANGQFYDTCVIPYTGLQGTETPPETVAALERQRDFLDLAEKPFQGRVVIYPAVQYAGAESITLINVLCRKVKSIGFQYVIVLSANEVLLEEMVHESDLLLCLPALRKDSNISVSACIREEIQGLWQHGK
jgi:23S rRNA (pseudouridine1915-N3)-methyltransferase